MYNLSYAMGVGNGGKLVADLTLSLWFAEHRHRLDSNFVWTMQDDVAWIGELGQILSMLQISTKSDYFAAGCMKVCGKNESLTCKCHTSFVRYSLSLLSSLYKSFRRGERERDLQKHTMTCTHVMKQGMRYTDILDVAGSIFDTALWGPHLHEQEMQCDVNCDGVFVSLEVFRAAEEDHRGIEHPHLSNVINFTRPAKPIGVIYRNVHDF